MFGEISHVFHVAAGESLHVRESSFEVVCDPGDDFGSPAVVSLAVEDFPSNAVVQTLMRTISRDAKATIDETGINYLHIAIGFLKRKETAIGEADGRLAPLIFFGVTQCELIVRPTTNSTPSDFDAISVSFGNCSLTISRRFSTSIQSSHRRK